VGALAIDERQGDQWGWAADYETAAAAQERALQEFGSGCAAVLTFGRWAAAAIVGSAGPPAVTAPSPAVPSVPAADIGAPPASPDVPSRVMPPAAEPTIELSTPAAGCPPPLGLDHVHRRRRPPEPGHQRPRQRVGVDDRPRRDRVGKEDVAARGIRQRQREDLFALVMVIVEHCHRHRLFRFVRRKRQRPRRRGVVLPP